MALYLSVLLILFVFLFRDVLGGSAQTKDTWVYDYIINQNQILYNACMDKERVKFSPVPVENWRNYNNPLYRRAFEIISANIDYETHLKQIFSQQENVDAESKMAEIFRNAKVCSYEGSDTTSNEECIKKSHADIYDAFVKFDNEEERKYYWTAWRDATGKKIRENLDGRYEYIAKRYSGNQYWLLEYETPQEEMLKDIEEAWNKLLPLYKQLHAFIRRKLIDKFGEKVKSNGPIPEHLIELFSRDWWPLKDYVIPYPEDKDIATLMMERKVERSEIIDVCEDFYRGLGFQPLKDFWNTFQIMEKHDSDCENSVFAGCHGFGASMRVCPEDDNGYYYFYYMIQNLISVHHEKWNRQNRNYTWPVVLNGYPNPGFDYAMRGVIDISVSPRTYGEAIDFVDRDNYADEEIYITNHLLKMALWSFVNLQYFYTIAKWRLDVSQGVFPQGEMNTKWWEYSLNYRGVCPPVKRTESDFDPGALPEVAENLPVVSEFLGGIYQFQFHNALCKATGTHNPLQSCNIYNSMKAGDKIRKVWEIGKSKPWQEVMEIITNGKSSKLDAQALLDYYEPLYNWLQNKNKNEHIGWESNDATVCP